MTPYERIFNRLEGNPVDKIPNLNIIMTFASKYIGINYSTYTKKYKFLVKGNIKCCNDFGIDMVSSISDPCREAYDFGASIIFPVDEAPMCGDLFIKEYSDIKKLSVKDPKKGQRMLDRLKAVELFRKEVGNYYPILGWVEGALAEAADLKGINKIMMDIIIAPEFVHELLEICTEQAISFGIEQIKAGADFIGIGDAVASLIGPKYYEIFALPYEQRIIDAIHNTGAQAKLHVCGNITSILDLIYKSGADIIDIDWMVDFERAVNIFKGKVSACGNFDPVSILLNGNEYDVEIALKKCVGVSDETTFIAAGCEVPKNTPLKNMKKVDYILRNLSLK